MNTNGRKFLGNLGKSYQKPNKAILSYIKLHKQEATRSYLLSKLSEAKDEDFFFHPESGSRQKLSKATYWKLSEATCDKSHKKLQIKMEVIGS